MIRAELAKKVLKFHKQKAEIIYKKTGIKYLLPADEDDILKANETDLIYFIKNSYGLSDGDFCFWCSRHYNDCGKCEYGKRHGICKLANSDYLKIIYNDCIRLAIITIISRKRLGEMIKELKETE